MRRTPDRRILTSYPPATEPIISVNNNNVSNKADQPATSMQTSGKMAGDLTGREAKQMET